MSIQCRKCKDWVEALPIHRCRTITPAKGEPMPRTIEYYIKRGDMDQELIMEMKEEISRLRRNVDKLRKKLGYPQ